MGEFFDPEQEGSGVLVCDKCKRVVPPGLQACPTCAMRSSGYSENDISTVLTDLRARGGVNKSAHMLAEIMQERFHIRKRAERMKKSEMPQLPFDGSILIK